MNYQELIKCLAPAYGLGEARAIANMVMDECYGLTQTDLLLGKDTTLSSDQRKDFEKIATRLIAGEPVQYVLGYTHFCGHRFLVSPSVLIPRPETEELVAAAVAFAEGRGSSICALDLCTGSGCIAVSLALALPEARIIGVDISSDALGVAQQNADELQACNVGFFRNDILDGGFKPDGSVNLIVSNPPYVMQSEAEKMSAHVLDHEPHLALFVPDDDPLRFYRAIADIGHRSLSPEGAILVEINSALASPTSQLFQDKGYVDVSVKADQFGRPRILQCTMPHA